MGGGLTDFSEYCGNLICCMVEGVYDWEVDQVTGHRGDITAE